LGNPWKTLGKPLKKIKKKWGLENHLKNSASFPVLGKILVFHPMLGEVTGGRHRRCDRKMSPGC